jgi:hypothetical protein
MLFLEKIIMQNPNPCLQQNTHLLVITSEWDVDATTQYGTLWHTEYDDHSSMQNSSFLLLVY